MKPIQIVGVVVLILGIFAVALAGSWRTGSETRTQLGPMHIETGSTERVLFPMWAGFAVIAIGGVLVVYPLVRKKHGPPKTG
jgi:hypothetical protein